MHANNKYKLPSISNTSVLYISIIKLIYFITFIIRWPRTQLNHNWIYARLLIVIRLKCILRFDVRFIEPATNKSILFLN